jgi:hypothetical protein
VRGELGQVVERARADDHGHGVAVAQGDLERVQVAGLGVERRVGGEDDRRAMRAARGAEGPVHGPAGGGEGAVVGHDDGRRGLEVLRQHLAHRVQRAGLDAQAARVADLAEGGVDVGSAHASRPPRSSITCGATSATVRRAASRASLASSRP